MLVYLDNCVFNRPFDHQSQERIRLETEAIQEIRTRIIRGEIELCWSYIIDVEVSRNPFPQRRKKAIEWKGLATKQVAPSIEIVSKALDIRGHRLRDIDSLHIACAIVSKSQYFVTTDDAILRKSSRVLDIGIIDPVELIGIVDKL